MEALVPRQGRTRASWPVIALVVIFLATTLPLIISGSNLGRYAWDQVNYHEKVVRTFMAQWPRPDLSNYLSATTPLYHLVLAAVGRYISASSTTLQLAGSLFTLALIVTLALALARTATALRVFVFTLVLMSSTYVYPAGVWMLPDNAAWWGVLGIVLIAWRCRFDLTLVAGGGLLMVVLVLTRQSHLWAAAALWASAWMSIDAKRQTYPHQRWRSPLGKSETQEHKPATNDDAASSTGDEDSLPSGTIRRIFTQPGRRLARTLVMMLATAPAFAVVWWFRKLWDGRLYPPCFDIQLNYPPNPAMTVFIMAVFGTINLFFAAFLLPRLAVLWRHARSMAIAILVASLVVAALPHTNASIPDGRYGGIWQIVGAFPVIAGRSPIIIALAVWGVFAIVGWCAALSRGPRIVVIVTLAGFLASQSIAHLAFQRYCEPLMILLTVLLAARTPEWPGPKWMHPFKLVGPAALAFALAAYTTAKISRDVVAVDEGTSITNVPPLIGHTPPPPRPPRHPAPPPAR